MDVIKLRGKLDTQQICEIVCQQLDEDLSDAFKKAIQRDLNHQVDINKLSVEYYSRDGAKIDGYDPDEHKNVKCMWFLHGTESRIQGSGILENVGCQIYTDKLLNDDLQITTGKAEELPHKIQFLFVVSGVLICLQIAKDAIPMNILFARTNGKIEESEINQVQNDIGKRTVLLKAPINRISAFRVKSPQKVVKKTSKKETDKAPSDLEITLGHCLFSFKNNDTVQVIDFDSTNGTSISSLDVQHVTDILNHWKNLNDQTIDETLKNLDHKLFQSNEITDIQSFNLPIIANLGGSFRVLVL
jgi:hypothetical protein